MIEQPFPLFEQFTQHLRIALFTKEDAAMREADTAQSLGAQSIASVEQVHGNKTVVVRAPDMRIGGSDGLATDRESLALCIRAADCQNFVIYAPEPTVVGLLHVGWRGLVAGAIEGFYEVLQSEWGIAPEETLVGAGPSLCTRCAEFTDPRRELPSLDSSFLHGRCADLRGAADAQFRSLGVLPERMERHPDCTRCHPEKYWTYRGGDRAAVRTGKGTNILACVLL